MRTRRRSLTLLALAVLGLLALGGGDHRPVTASVYPSIVQAGHAIRLRCHVSKDPANQVLEYGIVGYTISQRQLDGEAAPITWQTVIDHVPCDAGPGYCAVWRSGKWIRDEAPFEVAMCDP